jgi:hypothetical protein
MQWRAWVLTFGQHIVRNPVTKFLDPRQEVDPSYCSLEDKMSVMAQAGMEIGFSCLW